MEYTESPAEPSRAAAKRVRKATGTNNNADSLLEERVLAPTYEGKSKGKATSKDVSPRHTRLTFTRLPAELRNRIYDFVLWHSEGVRIAGDGKMVDPPSNFLTVIEACRQLHIEACLLPYSINTFVVDFNVIFWLRSLDDVRREAISSIELSFTLLMRLDYSGGTWYSDPVRQNESYLGMVLMVLPCLKHVNLAMRIEICAPVLANGQASTVAPEMDDVQRCLEPFRQSFEQSAGGVWITSTSRIEPAQG